MIQISSASGGAGIIEIINLIFDGIRYFWLGIGIFTFYVGIKNYFSQGANVSPIVISLLLKFFYALTAVNFAYSLVRPIINGANI